MLATDLNNIVSISTNILFLLTLAMLFLAGSVIAFMVRSRRLAQRLNEQTNDLREVMIKIGAIDEELRYVLQFIRELPHLTGELNSQMNPRGIPRVLMSVVQRTFRPQQSVVLLRRKKTLARPDGDREFVAAAVGSPKANFAPGMVLNIDEGELGYVAQQQRVLDRAALEREAEEFRSTRSTGLASFRSDLAAPMLVENRAIGLIALRGADRQTPYSNEIFRAIAQMGAFALNNLAAYAEVKSVADVDPLTKIWNKGVVGFRLGEQVYDADENDRQLSIFLFDIDHFKNYNDINGHVAGDRLLQLLARLVKEQTRMDDILGRFGGEEFLLILPNKTKSQAMITGDKIRQAIETFDFPGGDKQPLGRLTISGGVASFPTDGRSSSEILRAADQALYSAKRAGRNRVTAAKTGSR